VTSILLGILTISDAFVYLNLQRQGYVTAGAFPLLFVFTSACYLVAAIPVGRLADRFGAFATFIAGHAALIILYACLLAAMPGGWLVAFTVILLGLYYAATDGVLMALGSQLLSGEVRTTGLAVLTTGHASSRLVSSIVFGALWQQAGLRSTMTVFIVGLVLAIAAVLVMRPRSSR
jgi:MFS family permease